MAMFLQSLARTHFQYSSTLVSDQAMYTSSGDFARTFYQFNAYHKIAIF